MKEEWIPSYSPSRVLWLLILILGITLWTAIGDPAVDLDSKITLTGFTAGISFVSGFADYLLNEAGGKT